MKKGVYYKDVGYQRKGMNEAFGDRYYNIDFFLFHKEEDFLFAYNCIGGEWYLEHFGKERVDEMKENFKKNFIDNYEYGRSLLSVSF